LVGAAPPAIRLVGARRNEVEGNVLLLLLLLRWIQRN
jgi:hypothetical protein